MICALRIEKIIKYILDYVIFIWMPEYLYIDLGKRKETRKRVQWGVVM